MKEILGNLWDYLIYPDAILCITTNGTIKNDGTAVMGRGCAREALHRFPGIDLELGRKIKIHGNVVNELIAGKLLSFPVKYEWWQKADLDLIIKSAHQLDNWCFLNHSKTFILPKPGCGNGKVQWDEVKGSIENILNNQVFVIDF